MKYIILSIGLVLAMVGVCFADDICFWKMISVDTSETYVARIMKIQCGDSESCAITYSTWQIPMSDKMNDINNAVKPYKDFIIISSHEEISENLEALIKVKTCK